MKIAALYARVSTAKQQLNENIASQIAALKDYATRHDYQIGPQEIYQDDGIGHLEFPHKALESFVIRFLFGPARKGGGQNRKIDCSHGMERQEKSGYKFDTGFVPR